MTEPLSTAVAAAAAISDGRLTAEALLAACLERIAERDGELGAWECLDRDGALAAARALDKGPRRGLLHGLPVGVKDVVDVAGLPTRHGSPIFAGAPPAARDAAAIALARAAGAVFPGKTVTTEFANFFPGRTVNPHDPARTPGGSSSGSAAAVADGHVPLALGTQTAGSIIRPAAFCGVVGAKPSFGVIPRAGALALSDSLDTLGGFGRTVADAALLVAGLSNRPDLVLTERACDTPPRIGICRTPEARHASPATLATLEAVRRRAQSAGALVREVELGPEFLRLAEAQSTIQLTETARSLAEIRLNHRRALSERLRTQCDSADRIAPARVAESMNMVAACRALFPSELGDLDVVVAPSAPGAAPKGLGSTGDPVFNRIWTVLGVPAVHVPVTTDGDGMPLGVTVAGRWCDDRRVLLAAQWLERATAQ